MRADKIQVHQGNVSPFPFSTNIDEHLKPESPESEANRGRDKGGVGWGVVVVVLRRDRESL